MNSYPLLIDELEELIVIGRTLSSAVFVAILKLATCSACTKRDEVKLADDTNVLPVSEKQDLNAWPTYEIVKKRIRYLVASRLAAVG